MALFKSFNIPGWLIQKLTSLGYTKTTGIQELVIPQALKGKSLVVRSETGSGKTHCFLVPIVSNIDNIIFSLGFVNNFIMVNKIAIIAKYPIISDDTKLDNIIVEIIVTNISRSIPLSTVLFL